MFNAIAKVKAGDTPYTVKIGYDIPEIITRDTHLEVQTRIVVEDENVKIDTESQDYKEAVSIGEVLKIGFNIGCAYTMKVIEESTKMGEKLMNDPDAKITGSTSDLMVE